MTTWQRYVARVTNGATQTAIGEQSGIAQSTIGRWLNGKKAPTEAAKVAAFALAYDRNPLEAFVAAEMLSVDDAGRGLNQEERALLAGLSDDLSARRATPKGKVGEPASRAARRPRKPRLGD